LADKEVKKHQVVFVEFAENRYPEFKKQVWFFPRIGREKLYGNGESLWQVGATRILCVWFDNILKPSPSGVD